MASVLRYMRDAETLLWEVQWRNWEAEREGRSEFLAARTIQRHVRAYLERTHLAKLYNAALTIQKHWRGLLGRRLYMEKLREAVEAMLVRFYNAMATVIQKHWRGYMVRRKIHNHATFTRWRRALMQKQEEQLTNGIKFSKTQSEIAQSESEARARTNVFFILFKLHHMLRTEVTLGIYSLLDSKQLSILEEQLNELHLTEFVDHLHKFRAQMKERTENYSKGEPPFVKHRACQEFWWKRPRVNEEAASVFAQDLYGDCREPFLSARAENPVYARRRREWLHWYTPCPCMLLERNLQHEVFKEMPKLPMVFTREPSVFVPRLGHADPYAIPEYVPRGRDATLDISKHDFQTIYKSKDLSDTYTKCKSGPFISNRSTRSLMLLQSEDECENVLK